MGNELGQDLLPVKSHCKFREGRLFHGEMAYSVSSPDFSDWLVLVEPLYARSVTVLGSMTELVFVVLVF